ncbi:VC0807 family protein [Actinomadura oligospora]|uniref:VC0807 family protein n=1 Tax=Actinomadura oligospora TaxID=111804 RepID=UPI0004AF8918|nr:VC0807 family protein [Actinomadura oligospora]
MHETVAEGGTGPDAAGEPVPVRPALPARGPDGVARNGGRSLGRHGGQAFGWDGGHGFELPRLAVLLRHAAPRFVEGVIAPVAVFYAAFALFGLNGGLIAAVAWVYCGIAWRCARGHGVTGMLMLAALGVTVRAGLAAATQSAMVYFLQPTLGTLMVSVSFLASVPLRRPLAQKLATDMVPMPEPFLRHVRVRRFFSRVSLLWASVFLLNTGLSLWMLLHQSITVFLWVRTSLVAAIGAVAVAASVWGFRRCVGRVNADPAAA